MHSVIVQCHIFAGAPKFGRGAPGICAGLSSKRRRAPFRKNWARLSKNGPENGPERANFSKGRGLKIAFFSRISTGRNATVSKFEQESRDHFFIIAAARRFVILFVVPRVRPWRTVTPLRAE